MLWFVLRKLKKKSGLNLCLFAGITLLSGVFACHPMLEQGAGNELLQSGFLELAEESGQFPAVCSREGSYPITEGTTVQSVYTRMDAYQNKWMEYVEADPVISQQRMWLARNQAEFNLDGKSRYLQIGLFRDMEEHIRIVKGDAGSDLCREDADAIESGENSTTGEKGEDKEPSFPCLISEQVMDDTGLTVGEQLTFPYCVNSAGEPMVLVVTGICSRASDADNYWHDDLNDFEKMVLVSEDTFNSLIAEYGFENIYYEEHLLLNYTQMNSSNAGTCKRYLEEFRKADKEFRANFSSVLEEFLREQQKVRMILWVLELPCVVLLLLFIYMIAGKLLNAEEGEIAVLRSRGRTKGEILQLYLLQSGLLAGAGLLTGMGLSIVLCRCAVSTDGFLHFVSKDVSVYRPVWQMIPYGACAGIIAVLFMTVPVWKKAGLTVVQQKNTGYEEEKKPLWERLFLDVLLLGISLYLLYNYNRQSQSLAIDVLAGEALDPIVFLDVSLFLFSCSLFFLRLVRYLVLFIDRIGKKRWKAAMYASFLQISRTFYRQSFIVVFLIMTIANGIFSADMARTMNENNEARIRYHLSTDAKLYPEWKMKTGWYDGEYKWWYEEIPYDHLLGLKEEGLCESITRVLTDTRTDVTAGAVIQQNCLLMGIHTKEFGETARLADGLNEVHWFHALNALSQDADGVIISRNLAEQLKLKVGDSLRYTRYSPLELQSEQESAAAFATVRAIVDSFPGYERYRYVRAEDGSVKEQENYLIAANYASVISHFGLTPYSVWMRLADGISLTQLEQYIESQEIPVEQWEFLEEEVREGRSQALIQITNGMFTMSFLISLFVCLAGFLIYQILSVKSREMLFGVYRAMGMTLGEIHRMLLNEQLFTTLLSIAAGGGAGILAAALFVKLTVLVYLPEKHNIPIQTYLYETDLVRLFAVVLGVVAICFVILRRIIGSMKIAGALRLGED